MHGFTKIKNTPLPAFKMSASEYVHESGLGLIHLEKDDPNNYFCISFNTPPTSSNGVAHILEHCVLKGSKKYPLKELFVKLLSTSFTSFLNAFTYDDHTMYPLGSTNLVSFYQLMDIYLDVVFNPLLTHETFLTEGIRFEKDPASNIIFSGVVFNEMKGSMSDKDRILYEKMLKALYPDSPLAFNSGGDPREIISLTYDQLLSFHKSYYVPANAKIVLYGNQPIEESLKTISRFVKSDIGTKTSISNKIKFQPQIVKTDFASVEKKGMILKAWRLPTEANTDKNLLWWIVNYYLLGNRASVLDKGLRESGLGEDIAGWGVMSGLVQPNFTVGLKGTDPKDFSKIPPLIDNLLHTSLTNPNPEIINAGINQIKLWIKSEDDSGYLPRPLSLIEKEYETWIYDTDPLTNLNIDKYLQKLTENVGQTERLILETIEEFLIDNEVSTIEVTPNPKLSAGLEKIEQSLLESKLLNNPDEALNILKIWETHQKTINGVEGGTLPNIRSGDLLKELKIHDYQILNKGNLMTLTQTLETNGLGYLNLVFNLDHLTLSELSNLEFFSKILNLSGTVNLSREDLSVRKDELTREFHFYFDTYYDISGSIHFALFFNAVYLLEKETEVLGLLEDLLTQAKIETQTITETLSEQTSLLNDSLISNGDAWARSLSTSQLLNSERLNAQMDGYGYLEWIAKTTNSSNKSELNPKLEGLPGKITQSLSFASYGSPGKSLPSLDFLRSDFGQTSQTDVNLPNLGTAIVVGNEVNYCATSFFSPNKINGSLALSLNFLRDKALWDEIRTKGGAYGIRLRYSKITDIISLSSYRDPHIEQTFEVFQNISHYFKNLPSQKGLDGSIVSYIGSEDSGLLTPKGKIYDLRSTILSGHTPETEQKFRNEVFATTVKDFKEWGEKIAEVKPEDMKRAVVGNGKKISKASKKWGLVPLENPLKGL